MNCEDCENYKAKKDGEFSKVTQGIRKLGDDFCSGRDCGTCPAEIADERCMFQKMDDLLDKAEGKE